MAATHELSTSVTSVESNELINLPDKIAEIIPANLTSAILQRSMFQIVVLAILMAIALVSIKPERAKPLLNLCVSLQDVSMKVVSWAMTLAPAAVFGLISTSQRTSWCGRIHRLTKHRHGRLVEQRKLTLN